MDASALGIEIINLPTFSDERGRFRKVYDGTHFPDFMVAQSNFVTSPAHVLRGLHFQRGAAAESKIFQVISGKIQLAFFSLAQRKGDSIVLDSSAQAVRIPKGLATGYLVLEDNTQVLYFSDHAYVPDAEGGLRWNDPLLSSIEWKINAPLVSVKDQNWPDFL
jgi:dTDP-4-dehydrorhamnose 3,5-epimerase